MSKFEFDNRFSKQRELWELTPEQFNSAALAHARMKGPWPGDKIVADFEGYFAEVKPFADANRLYEAGDNDGFIMALSGAMGINESGYKHKETPWHQCWFIVFIFGVAIIGLIIIACIMACK